uniref:hypothetical protein n=1 Tax=Umezawaea endophytica TaxID=1654476 RepID=UPI0036DADA66
SDCFALIMSSQTVLPPRISAHNCAVDTSTRHRSPFSRALSVIVVSAASAPACAAVCWFSW